MIESAATLHRIQQVSSGEGVGKGGAGSREDMWRIMMPGWRGSYLCDSVLPCRVKSLGTPAAASLRSEPVRASADCRLLRWPPRRGPPMRGQLRRCSSPALEAGGGGRKWHAERGSDGCRIDGNGMMGMERGARQERCPWPAPQAPAARLPTDSTRQRQALCRGAPAMADNRPASHKQLTLAL